MLPNFLVNFLPLSFDNIPRLYASSKETLITFASVYIMKVYHIFVVLCSFIDKAYFKLFKQSAHKIVIIIFYNCDYFSVVAE